MLRQTLLVALLVPLTGTAALAGGLPGTLNFRNVTASRVISTTAESVSNEKAVEIGDFDEDGDLDVVIAVAFSDFGARKNKLYENVGGVMTEITTTGVINFAANKVSRVPFMRDYDMDGHLDIWIINDDNSHNDQLFIAQWAAGSFVQFNEENNRIPGGAITGAACSGWSADFNQSGFPDVYCGNYPNSAQDRLLSNNGAGFFANITSTHVVLSNDYVVDVNGADINGDGKLDLLISQFGSHQNRIYYNDNLNAGSGIGDFSYANSQQNLGNPSANENSMDAGDFDGDGDMDIYWSQQTGSTGDRILRNNGNDASNRATFTILNILPVSATGTVSRKVEVADLNADGRVDLFVTKGSNNGRPTVLRNTTVGGVISFVDWSAAAAFPTGNNLTGWNAAIFDTNGDGDLDIFIGGWAGEHLLEHVASTELIESELKNDVVPSIFNKNPAAVVGESGPTTPDVFIHNGLATDSFMSVIVNGPDDYLVELLDGADVVLVTIDRGGLGVEEAVQYDPAIMPATLKVRITAQACANPFNVSGDCSVGITDFLDLLGAWGANPGHPADFDNDGFVGITDFFDLLGGWGTSEYIAEFLARTG